MSLENFKPKRRVFRLKGDKEPVAYKIRTSHRSRYPLLQVDMENGTQRELRYATNMMSPFVDEQEDKGVPTLGHIWFRNGVLAVNDREMALQKFLLVHPDNMENGGNIFYEVKPEEAAKQDVVNLEAAANALSIAKDLDAEDAAFVVYANIGRRGDGYASTEVRRDVLNLALNDAPKFLSILEDEHLRLKFTAHQALRYQVLTEKGSSVFFGNTKKKLMTVAPSMDVEDALAKFFLTDDGIAALEEVKAKLSKLLS